MKRKEEIEYGVCVEKESEGGPDTSDKMSLNFRRRINLEIAQSCLLDRAKYSVGGEEKYQASRFRDFKPPAEGTPTQIYDSQMFYKSVLSPLPTNSKI